MKKLILSFVLTISVLLNSCGDTGTNPNNEPFIWFSLDSNIIYTYIATEYPSPRPAYFTEELKLHLKQVAKNEYNYFILNTDFKLFDENIIVNGSNFNMKGGEYNGIKFFDYIGEYENNKVGSYYYIVFQKYVGIKVFHYRLAGSGYLVYEIKSIDTLKH